MSQEEAPKIQVDADWKAEAQAEKERLAQAEERVKSRQPAQGELPPAEFRTLMGMLAQQAIMGLGAMTDPETKGVMIDLEGAKFAIDLLAVLEEKTKGNLTDEETTEITTLISELRSRFVQLSEAVAQQMAAQGAGGAAAAPAADTPPSIIMPD